MQALILAGGKGSRLRPYTTVLPKPLMPLGEYPVLEIILRQLRRAGVEEVILAVGYMAHLFQAFFQDGARFQLRIHYSLEERALGTAGPIGLTLDLLEEEFLVLNGDLLTTLSYRDLFEFHRRTGAAATIAVYDREIQIDFGVVESDDEGRLLRYIEKPRYPAAVSMGVNVLQREAVRGYIKPNQYLDIPDLVTQLVRDGRDVRCYREACRWLDIGRVEDYQAAAEEFARGPTEFLADET